MSISWQTTEFEYVKKSSDWFWSLWIIFGAMIVVSIIYQNVLLAILFFFITFVLSLQATRKPKIIKIEINSSGVIIGNKKYIFENLESYWIDENNKPRKILFKLKKSYMPYPSVSLDGVETERVDNFLDNFLAKEELTEPLLYKFEKFF